MGCFLACFGSSKKKRGYKRTLVSSPSSAPCSKFESSYKPVVQNLAPKQAKLDESIVVVSQSPVKQEEQLSAELPKKVTFVSNVRLHDPIFDSVKKTAEISPGIKQYEHEKIKVNGVSIEEQNVLPPASESGGSALSSLESCPTNHRYHNCRESDNEDEIEYEEEIDVDDYNEDKDATEIADDVYEDSLNPNEKWTPESISSMESRTKSSVSCLAMRNLDGMLDDGSLVEKLTQLKSIKAKDVHEHAVDASLSSWLVASQQTPARKAILPSQTTGQSSASSHGSNTVRNFSDRPILGALTMEQLKLIQASESLRKSPSHSAVDSPIIGSVGSHWSEEETPSVHSASYSTFKGIPNTTTKYREDKMVKWHTTPFETRLEQALKKGGTGVPF